MRLLLPGAALRKQKQGSELGLGFYTKGLFLPIPALQGWEAGRGQAQTLSISEGSN